MKVIVRGEAADDLEQIFAWIAKDNLKAATQVIRHLRERIGRLETPGLEHMGRLGVVASTRELVAAPYIIVYQITKRERIEIVAIFHGRQDR